MFRNIMGVRRDSLIGLTIVIVILIVFYNTYFKYSQLNTERITSCATDNVCQKFNVHREHDDPKAAAALIQEITRRNKILIDYLEKTYMTSNNVAFDPYKSNKIDVVPTSELYPAPFGGSTKIDTVALREYIQQRIEQLVTHYDKKKIYEISPLNKNGYTSYAEEKRTLILCLRHKTKDEHGNYPLHDVNTLVFVCLHELAHMMNDQWGHDVESNFWPLFKFLLEAAVQCDIIKIVDYSKHPIYYCGLKLNYNPILDERL